MKKLTTEIFIERSINTHGIFYDYSLVDYIDADTKVIIICPIHGEFKQTLSKHVYRKQGCPECNGGVSYTKKQFLDICKIKHDNFYDYSLVKYINSNTKIKIICPIHDEFKQIARNHSSGSGCKKCNNEKLKYNQLDTNQFIINSKNIHGDFYDYSNVNYINGHTKVEIICPKHDRFFQKPSNHVNMGQGCPICQESKGERKILHILKDNNINYIKQKIFKSCKHKKHLPFDFYLPDYNLCIEYDGKQHYESVEYWGGEKEFKNIQIRDKIKNKYCKDNNIKLVRIKYNENILDKLKLNIAI